MSLARAAIRIRHTGFDQAPLFSEEDETHLDDARRHPGQRRARLSSRRGRSGPVTRQALSSSVSAVVGRPPAPLHRLDPHQETMSIATLPARCGSGGSLVLQSAWYARGDREAGGAWRRHIDHDVPVTPQTVFSIASVDKQFTALAVMLLVEEHKVSLDEPIGRYIAEVPASWNEIRVRHLLTHTSGLGDAAQEVADGPRSTRATTRGGGHPAHHPDPPPGTRWRSAAMGSCCSNSSSSESAGSSITSSSRRVLQPLDMTDTRFLRAARGAQASRDAL